MFRQILGPHLRILRLPAVDNFMLGVYMDADESALTGTF
jgi:hypothetical protein